MNRLLTTGLAGGVLLLGLAAPLAGQVKKKPDEPPKDRKLSGILKDFKHKDAKVRVAALQDLLQMAEVRTSDVTPALPLVFPMLKDTDAGVRRLAILVLDTLEADPKLFVPPLVDILKKDKDTTVRYAAVVAVGHIGPPAKAAVPALEAIQKSVKDNPKEKLLAASVSEALQKIRKKK
jgi:vesicle coat complex subunit